MTNQFALTALILAAATLAGYFGMTVVAALPGAGLMLPLYLLGEVALAILAAVLLLTAWEIWR